MPTDNSPITIIVPGAPRGKGRPRFRRVPFKLKNNNSYSFVYPDPGTKAYEKVIATMATLAMRGRAPLSGPVKVNVDGYFPIPMGFKGKKLNDALEGRRDHFIPIDYDNLLKIALDGINGIVFTDDRRVIGGHTFKHYSEFARLRIEIISINLE